MNFKITNIHKNIQHHGVKNLLYQQSLKLINKVVFFNILTCIVISKVKQSSLEIAPQYEHGFIEKDKLLNFTIDKENELSNDFIESAYSNGDECYAVTESGTLASYGWYSNRPTQTNVQKLYFCFDSNYMYMYKGLTKKYFRGQKLHAVGMSWALNNYQDKGFRGLVSYVDSTNFDSLKSCWRMGYKKAGNIYIIKIFGKVFHYPTRSCKAFNIHLKDI